MLLLYSNLLLSQTRQVSGKITDATDNSPLPGVTVTAKGTKSAVITGPDGGFKISVNTKASTLHISYIGYEDKEIPLGSGNEPLALSLSRAKSALSEVVVVGYGKASKKDLSGSISRLDAKAVEELSGAQLRIRDPGKSPRSRRGHLRERPRPGRAIQINIRGISSISASSQPLYVVDGLPVTTASLSDPTNNPTNPLADINPNDIESVEILKDASAASIYGARAANGVVLVTTKKGKNTSKTNIELNTSTGISNPARERKFMNAKQYLQFVHDAANNDGWYDFTNGISNPAYPSLDSAQSDYFNNPNFGYASFFDGSNGNNGFALGTDWRNAAVNTNWQKASLHQNAPNNQINLSASGGNDKTRFFISGFYNTQDAIVINNTFSRYGTRFNIDHNATDKLVLGLNMAVDRSQLDKVTNDNAFSSPGQLVAQLPCPLTSIRPRACPITKPYTPAASMTPSSTSTIRRLSARSGTLI